MALVFRSDRKTIFDIKKKRFDTGPGQYLPLDIRSKIELNKVPFSSSSKKESDKERKEGNPGPGFYQKDDDMENFFNSLDRNKVKKKGVGLQSKNKASNSGFHSSLCLFRCVLFLCFSLLLLIFLSI